MNIGEEFERLVSIMTKLRGPEGCPWDREQTHDTIKPYCIEEAYEVVDAIDARDSSLMAEELGDLLLQIVFHAQLGFEENTFTILDVLNKINEKLVRRHPHVFKRRDEDGDLTSKQVLENWSESKKKEGRKSILDGVPHALPSLLKATRLTEKAATVGFDWKNREDVEAKVEEEWKEFKNEKPNSVEQEEEFGDLLFAMANLARHLKIDPEIALRKSCKKFERRFRWMETEIEKDKKDMRSVSLKELDAFWDKAKKAELG